MKSRLLISVSALALLGSQAIAARTQDAPSYTVLHTFSGADGEFPTASVIRDRAGNLYGTTFNGGDLSKCGGSDCGVAFKVDRSAKENVLYSFTEGTLSMKTHKTGNERDRRKEGKFLTVRGWISGCGKLTNFFIPLFRPASE